MENNDEIRRNRIRFEFTDESGNEFINESTIEIFYSLGETVLDTIGERLNIFLKQCGFPRERPYLFMRDITAEEYDALEFFLDDLRGKNSKIEEPTKEGDSLS